MFTSKIAKNLKRVLLPMFLITGLCLFLITINSGTAFADTVGPVYTQISPDDGATLNKAFIYGHLQAVDQDKVDINSIVMTVDGETVQPTNYYYNPVNESTDDLTTLVIDYWSLFTSGPHTISVSTSDKLGNASSTTWTFTVNPPLKASAMTPANGAVVSTLTPVVSALLTPVEGINPDSVAMTINNNYVNAAYDPIAGKITYIPESPLNNETYYNVGLKFKDLNGTETGTSWQFYVNTYKEMPYSIDDAACQQCHDKTAHPMKSCTKCHGYNASYSKPSYPEDDCYKCHYGSKSPYPATYHLNGLPDINPLSHGVQITGSCLDCHSKTWAGTVIPQAHLTLDNAVKHTTTSIGCSQCHSTSLTREHQRRQDAQGNTLTCYTCHNNPDENVQNAIATKNTSCGACHTGVDGGHPAHNNGLDQYCQTCHSSTILEEPQFHSKNECAVCHQNTTNPLVGYSIKAGDTSCFACHTQGHNVNFVKKNPDDIPLYPGYQWTVPQPAAIWGGEAWLPDEFNTVGAKLVISNRRADISGSEIFDWYTQNLTDNGWQKSAGRDQGSEFFTLSYEKGGRKLNVNVYTGESHDQASGFAGCRVELLYK